MESHGPGGRRMDLQRQLVPRIQNFAKDGKTVSGGGPGTSEDFRRIIFHEPSERFAGKTAVDDDTLVPGPVGNFPGLADGFGRRQFFMEKPLQFTSAPDALLKNRLKNQRIQYGHHLEARIKNEKDKIRN